jgi:lysozyme family protein
LERVFVALSTAQQRTNWRAFECREELLTRIVFGPEELRVAPPTAPVFQALAAVLASHNYVIHASDTSSYCCRAITGGSGPSLHSYGIAVDVNASTNPYKKTPDSRAVRFSQQATQEARARDVRLGIADTDMTPEMIADVEAIVTHSGKRALQWGGRWETIKDPMHFEITVTPADLASGIDPGSVAAAPGPVVSRPMSGIGGASMSGNFERCMIVVEKWEGNFDNDPDDPGGPTNMGVTQADLARARGHAVSVDDVRNLSRAEAREIFRTYYWNPIRGDELPLPVAQMCLDSAILRGVGRATKDMQQALNECGGSLAVDGQIGPGTISRAAMVDGKMFVSAFANIAEAYLRSRPGFPKYGKGWLNRLNDVRATAFSMVGLAPATAPHHRQDQAKTGDSGMPAPTNDLVTILQQVIAILQNTNVQPKPEPAPAPAQPTDQLRQLINILTALTGGSPPAQGPQLGPVNGALGDTIGNLLNGKKSAIGIIGSVLTGILGNTGLGTSLAGLAPAALTGLSGYALPIFLGMAAWGALGKMEKWSGASPSK